MKAAQKVQPMETAVTSGPRKASGYVPTLDGWRAVAILWVIFAHSQIARWGPFSDAWIVKTGGRGVQVFFALSGFLICGRLLREEKRFGGISLRSFYTRRLFRIQPAAITYLAVVSLLTLAQIIPPNWGGIFAAFFMVRNLNVWHIAPGMSGWPTGHFWSLSAEEHFYLLLPGFLVLVKRHRLKLLSLGVVLLELWRILVFQTPALRGSGITDLRTDAVLGGILLGSTVALALTRERVREFAVKWCQPLVAILFTVIVFWFIDWHQSRINHALLISVYPLLIVASVLHPTSWLGKFLELAPLRYIGRISYSLYLWQELFFNPIVTPTPGSLRSHVQLCWVLTFALALASYYLIEQPLVKIGHRMAKKFDRAEAQHHQLAVEPA